MPNNRHSLQAETLQQRTSQDQRENGATTLERSESKTQSSFVETITHRKPLDEWFKMDTRSQSYGLKPNDLLRQDNHLSELRERIAFELT